MNPIVFPWHSTIISLNTKQHISFLIRGRKRTEVKQLLSGHADMGWYYAFILMTIQQQLSCRFKKGSVNHAGQRFSKGSEMGDDINEYVCLTDLCLVWCQLGWRRQEAPDWVSVHRAFRAAWSCPRGSDCRCHDRQNNPLGKTLEVQGYDYLRLHDHALARNLLKIQLQYNMMMGLWAGICRCFVGQQDFTLGSECLWKLHLRNWPLCKRLVKVLLKNWRQLVFYLQLITLIASSAKTYSRF